MLSKDEFRKIQAKQENKMDRRAMRLLEKGDVNGYLFTTFHSIMFTAVTSFAYHEAEKATK